VGAFVETDGGTRLLIDTPPELRLELVANGIDWVDAVLFTRDHADHTHGLDDVRAMTNARAMPLTMYGASDTLARLRQRFPYIFDETMQVLPGTSKPEGRARSLEAGVTVRIGDAAVTPVAVPHGLVTVFAYRIDDLAYVTDAKSIPPEAIAVLRGAKVLVINALFRTQHPSHLSLPEAVSAAREIGAARTYLTHLTHDNLHADLAAELPHDIQPAFDGLTVQL
jgi:phosphoribosyl 1,2-cyclic phosphate phosphodiesterase